MLGQSCKGAALKLGRDAVLLARIMEWCEAKDHAGVRGEASRLLAALIRHSRSPEVVRAVARTDGVRHLISMATSEHVIMQNEALVALAIASAIDIESMRDPFREAELLPTLKNMLDDPVGAVEVKFSAMGLICTLANSGCTPPPAHRLVEIYSQIMLPKKVQQRQAIDCWKRQIL
ncbi:hypothetical protein AMECASPLE_035834 [Ameca splendens]|uniref:Uncharacterized protein n=1 Tax=Ameca splendens TaxID=208324 RepID=A0ABV0Y7B5_9TELE